MFVGEVGTYFDGDTEDTDELLYEWTATPNASPSTATPPSLPPSGGSSLEMEFRPRAWLVI